MVSESPRSEILPYEQQELFLSTQVRLLRSLRSQTLRLRNGVEGVEGLGFRVREFVFIGFWGLGFMVSCWLRAHDSRLGRSGAGACHCRRNSMAETVISISYRYSSS